MDNLSLDIHLYSRMDGKDEQMSRMDPQNEYLLKYDFHFLREFERISIDDDSHVAIVISVGKYAKHQKSVKALQIIPPANR